MHSLVRLTLTTYLREKRLPKTEEIPAGLSQHLSLRYGVFVTLRYQGKIIASSGRIQCQKENTLAECIDNTIKCLQDKRFSAELQSLEELEKVEIRVDILDPSHRRIIQDIHELDPAHEGLILLSQSQSVMSILLPGIEPSAQTAEDILSIASQKAGVNISTLGRTEYILYAITTEKMGDF